MPSLLANSSEKFTTKTAFIFLLWLINKSEKRMSEKIEWARWGKNEKKKVKKKNTWSRWVSIPEPYACEAYVIPLHHETGAQSKGNLVIVVCVSETKPKLLLLFFFFKFPQYRPHNSHPYICTNHPAASPSASISFGTCTAPAAHFQSLKLDQSFETMSMRCSDYTNRNRIHKKSCEHSKRQDTHNTSWKYVCARERWGGFVYI